MKEELIRLKIDHKNHIALWKKTPEENINNKNILLAHGTFSNRKVLNGIAEFLTHQGFTCWIFEWRNHGHSSRLKDKFNFETIGKQDFIFVFNYLFEEQKIETIDCITHSGGGICLTIALIHKPHYKSQIKSITMFACQAFGASDSIKNYLKILIGKYGSSILGYLPARKVGSEENEDYFLMKQWFNWNLSGEFIGEDGQDYEAEMKDVKIPILSIFGSGDNFIAPPKACKAFLAAYNNPVNEFLFCSKENGFLENYNHGRIIHSRSASKEIYPKVLAWINKHAENFLPN